MSITYEQLKDMAKAGTARAIEDEKFDAIVMLVESLMDIGGSRLSPDTGMIEIPPLRVGFMEKSGVVEAGKNYFEMGDDFIKARAITGGNFRFRRLTEAQAGRYENVSSNGCYFYTRGRRIHFLFDVGDEASGLGISYWGKIPHLTADNAETHELFGVIPGVYLSGLTAQVLHNHRSYSDSFSYWQEFREGIISANRTYGEDAVQNLGSFRAPRVRLGV